MGAMKNNSAASYVDWEEVMVSSEKGRREVHYYLNRCDGGRGDLVVVGKEKRARHMSYRCTIENNKLLSSLLNRPTRLKLRSRGEVIDWLNSILSGKLSNCSLMAYEGTLDSKLDGDIVKGVMLRKVGYCGTEFTWLGSSWTCRKRRRHYQSFSRNGSVISAQDFVYVLAEENKRLVAYLDDLYEDTRGNAMVVVRWFHKLDEVGFVLSPNYNDREIFFSLCLQDLSIECIDGLATVLSPEHYDMCINDAEFMGLTPLVCYRQFDNYEVSPFDVTLMKGYWKQEIVRKIMSPLVVSVEIRPNKRVRWSKECDLHLRSPEKVEAVEASLQGMCGNSVEIEGAIKMGSLRDQCLCISSEVEVLSQDSGIRGCWFRALIIKKHKDMVKVQYKDIRDATDDTKYLEEWILSSRLAKPDALGIRLSRRSLVRPTLSDKGRYSGVVNVGSVVDVWWNDGWWEGIVVKKKSEYCINVYFPDEKREVTVTLGYLRHSMEWLETNWQNIKERPDIVSKASPINKITDIGKETTPSDDNRDLVAPINNDTSPQNAIKICYSEVANESRPVRYLPKENILSGLGWKSYGKRSRNRNSVHKTHYDNSHNNNNAIKTGLESGENCFVNSSLKFDSDNWKYSYDSHSSSSTVTSLTKVLMSR